MIEKKSKQPHETLDYDFNALRPLGNDDTITGVTASYSGPDRLLFIERALVMDEVTPKVWLSGGTDGATYKVTILATTAAGRVIEGEFLLYVKDR